MHVGMVREHWTWGVRKYSRPQFSNVHSTSMHPICLLLVAQGPQGHHIQRSHSWRKVARERCFGWGHWEGNDHIQRWSTINPRGHHPFTTYIYIYLYCDFDGGLFIGPLATHKTGYRKDQLNTKKRYQLVKWGFTLQFVLSLTIYHPMNGEVNHWSLNQSRVSD